jgi:hypothetical protein
VDSGTTVLAGESATVTVPLTKALRRGPWRAEITRPATYQDASNLRCLAATRPRSMIASTMAMHVAQAPARAA